MINAVSDSGLSAGKVTSGLDLSVDGGYIIYLKDVSQFVQKQLKPTKVHQIMLGTFSEKYLPCSRESLTWPTHLKQTDIAWSVMEAFNLRSCWIPTQQIPRLRENLKAVFRLLEWCRFIFIRLGRYWNQIQLQQILACATSKLNEGIEKGFHWPRLLPRSPVVCFQQAKGCRNMIALRREVPAYPLFCPLAMICGRAWWACLWCDMGGSPQSDSGNLGRPVTKAVL